MRPNLEVLACTPDGPVRGQPLLFVHGMWHGAWCWERHMLPYFAQHGREAYAVSLRGHGKSEGRDRLRWTPLAAYVADLASVVEQIGTPGVLVGHSMGGMVVQKYLEAHRAPGAVLLASVPPQGLLGATIRVARRHPWAFLKANLTLSLYPVIDTPEKCRELLFSDSMDPQQVEEYWKLLQDESYRAYLDMLFFDLPRPERVDTEVLVLGAENDGAICEDEVRATARAYGVEAEIFPGMAHDMMLEDGWRRVADWILTWLEARGL